MNTYIITRHVGAVEWMRRHHPDLMRGATEIMPHADRAFFDKLEPGDVVVGVLPLPLIAEVCKKGAAFYALNISLPQSMRGMELSADDMERLGASIRRYEVKEL